MTFTQTVFRDIQPLLSQITAHPFNRALADGTLDRNKFIYYMQQDSLYLIDYARALALVGARFTDEASIRLLLEFSQGALIAERELHEHYFKTFDVSAETAKGPACMMYTSYLVERAATANLGEAFAALLPCFWIYHQVGLSIVNAKKPENPYSPWIDLYSSQEFADIVQQAVQLTDRLAGQSSEAEKSRMADAFMISTRMEYCFWDDAEHCRQWPL